MWRKVVQWGSGRLSRGTNASGSGAGPGGPATVLRLGSPDRPLFATSSDERAFAEHVQRRP
jgi:hypothetical protein